MTEEMSIISNPYVASFPEFSHNALQQFINTRSRADILPVLRIFLARYKAFPCTISCAKGQSNILFHISSVTNYLQTQLQHDITKDIVIRKYHQGAKQFYVSARLVDLGDGIIICIKQISPVLDVENPNKFSPDLLDTYYLISQTIQFYYLPENDIKVHHLAKEFLEFIVIQNKSFKLHMICRNQNYYLKAITVRKPMIFDIGLHYGENFVYRHEKILKELNKKEGKGIVLLHGLPGSGKTHYIRYLIAEIEQKTMIYVPPDMAKDISKPEFLAFLLTQPNSIIIIEDAENIIRDRNAITVDATQAVANLLNLSDGLLGDAMHIQIIATFNCNLNAVDKALLRKGRLIANYEFGKLDVNQAKILSDKLGFGKEHISTSMTLAEIYNQKKEDDIETIV